jgi:PIN domain nuclease of toxin-antitoxin system
MKLLLDTCTFLWIILDDQNLSEKVRELYSDPDNEIYLSSVSVWEISLKNALGRLPLPEPIDYFVSQQREQHGISPLPLDEISALQLPRLPELHRDPFDRMLICQAIANGLPILTPDQLIVKYPVRSIW